MANKGIFIGMGGSGVKTVAHLKAKLRQAAPNRKDFEETCRFIFIDTDEKDINMLNREYRSQFDDELIDAAERIELGRVNPLASYINIKSSVERGSENRLEKRLFETIDPRGTATLKNERLNEGASANRQQGRIAISVEADEIGNAVGNAISHLSSITQEKAASQRILIYLVSGTCGGTGSSAFLDVAYLIDRKYKQMRQAGDPKIRSVLFMPNWYIERYRQDSASAGVIENFQLNSYAFADELDFFLRDHFYERELDGSGEKFSAVCIDPTVDDGIIKADRKWKVFSYGICVDSTTESGASLTDDQMYRNTAEMLFYLHQGDTERAVISTLDNEIYENCAIAASEGSVPAFVTMGYRALQFPEGLMRDYFTRRFLYELFSFGLLGRIYIDALPDDEVRQTERTEVFRQCIRRYLFKSDQEADVPNLEDSGSRICAKFLNSFNTQSFEKTERGIISRFISKEGEIEFDEDKISDASELNRFLAHAETIARKVQREIQEDFQNRENPTGREKILKYVRFGAEVESSTARTGSLERILEDSILCFGLRYTTELTRKLDDLSEAKRSELGVGKQNKNERLSRLEAEISHLQATCLADDSKKSEKINALAALEQKLGEMIRTKAEIQTIDCQIRVLNDLSEGESGILDQYKRNLAALIRSVTDKIMGDQQGGNFSGLRDDFMKHLPSRFIETEKDVTTTYLPDVSSFVQNDEWTSDNLFSILYKAVVEHISIPGGGSEPLRHGAKQESYREKRGLHLILGEMLTDKNITGGQQGFERAGEIVYFRQFFTIDSTQPPDKLVNQMVDFAGRYIAAKMRQSERVQSEVNKSLLDRLNDTDPVERQRVEEKFSDRGTQTFCRMNDPIRFQPAIRALYVGSQGLAEKLGHDESRTQLLDDNSPNRFLKIKFSSGHLLSAYPHHQSLAEIYRTVREDRRRKQYAAAFVPHIHRAFNDHGVAQAMSLLTQHLDESVWQWFVAALLYRETFDAAAEVREDLLNDIFFYDTRQTGIHETCRTPFIIEEIPNTEEFRVLACTEVKQKDGKLLLEKGDFENVKAGQLDHQDLFDGLMSRPDVRTTVIEIDRYFRNHCSSDWLEVFNQAETSLGEKLRVFRESIRNTDLQEFYDKINRKFTDFADELRHHIGSRQKGAVKPEEAETPKVKLRL